MSNNPILTSLPATRSVSHRFAVTLAAQISKSALSFLMGMIVARSLGPLEYGNLAFLLGSFTAIRLVLDIATGQAFFTLSAQRPRGIRFFFFYAGWLTVFQFCLPALLILFLLPQDMVNFVWQSQSREHIALAFLATHLQYLLWPQIIQLGEVVRRTTISQLLTISISLVQFIATIVLMLSGSLTLQNYLILIVFTFAIGVTASLVLLPRPWNPAAPLERFTSVLREFAAFCGPLVISMALQATSGLTEVWLLQRYAGPVAQGFFALGMQISLIGLLATTSLQNIFWREVAELQDKDRHEKIHEVYVKTSRALLLASALPIAFMICWAPQIVSVLLGQQYRDATPVIAVMLLYPISQAIATLAIVMFSVMRKTRILAAFSSLYATFYILGSYLLVAPPDATIPGLGMGAFAVGMKLTFFGFAQLLIWEGWINRHRGWRSDWPHRLGALAILVAIAAFTRILGGLEMLLLPPLPAIMIAGTVYLALAAIALWRWPAVMGVPPHLRSAFIGKLPDFLRRRIA